MEKRYGALRVIGTIFKILGVLVGIFAVLGALALCGTALLGGAALANAGREAGLPFAGAGVVGAIISGLFSLLIGIIWAVTLFAVGDFVSILLSIEENTRSTAVMLRSQPQPPASTNYPPPPPMR